MDSVLLAHGSGGKLQSELLNDLILKYFKNSTLKLLEDSARLTGKIAFTTDSYVVKPIFFKGGNIGKLAVAGTVNDLLCVGAIPLYISIALIIEEGFKLADLERIIDSSAKEASQSHVEIVCGDIKVVEHGKGDGIYINTSGIGKIEHPLSPKNICVGDIVMITGTIGDHGIALLSEREGMELDVPILSDASNLLSVANILFKSPGIHCIRDPTRGGLGGILKEVAIAANLGIEIDEESIPIRSEVRATCELLGLDPLYIANEGKFVIFDESDKVLDKVKKDSKAKDAAVIGKVVRDYPGDVILHTKIGGKRLIELPRGELLPRIC
ncbi:MAG: hydrogenase expression/formation protein HypE [bacterium]|nr:hydrogenase expression/formation protein HypE [bacterium]